MFMNQRKMMRTTRNSQWRHQQKAGQNKREFFKKPWTAKLQSIEIETQKIKKFDHWYDGGQVNLSTFVDHQFNLIKGHLSEKSRRSRNKAISNSLILKEILSHVNFSTLISARLVCKEWKNLANFELGRRNCCCVRFQRNFLVKEDLDLSVLRNSVDFSWLEFDLGNLEEMELEYISTFWGSQIKMLKIHPFDFSLFNRFFSAGEFSNVKTLSFPDNFDGKDSEKTTTSPLTGEFRNLLKLLRKESNSNSNLAVCKTKVNAQLERLVIGNQNLENKPEFVDQINQILEANKKSLKFLELPLELCSSSTFRPRIRLGIPGILSQVSTIHFHMHCDNRIKVENQRFQLPRGFEQENLPNLKTVRFEFNFHAGSWSDCSFLPPEETKTGKASCLSLSLRSVINLEIGFKNNSEEFLNCSYSLHHLISSKWFPWFSAFFPNIQKVTVDHWNGSKEILGHVFKVWPNLITLEIHSHFLRPTESKVLDSVFTGFSKEKYDELRKNPELVPMSLEIGEMKTEPNLSSLKELKRLDICVFGPSPRCPVSKLSSLYAFHLNPELKVTIRHFPKEVTKCKCVSCQIEEVQLEHIDRNNSILKNM